MWYQRCEVVLDQPLSLLQIQESQATHILCIQKAEVAHSTACQKYLLHLSI